ncbi:hypothetical protein HDU76_000647 [Blyttiomyces sp. JEL0837]|nr:hypothetical protein HDU76_000647 [Blyttiomyces sp. JEL0837]
MFMKRFNKGTKLQNSSNIFRIQCSRDPNSQPLDVRKKLQNCPKLVIETTFGDLVELSALKMERNSIIVALNAQDALNKKCRNIVEYRVEAESIFHFMCLKVKFL